MAQRKAAPLAGVVMGSDSDWGIAALQIMYIFIVLFCFTNILKLYDFS